MPNDTTIRADAIAGMLVDWFGPVLGPDGRTHVRIGAWTPRFPDDSVIVVADGPGAMSDDGPEVGAAPMSALRLDCLRPEVQAHIGRVLAAGVRCAHDWVQAGYARRECSKCRAMMAQIGFQCRGCGGIPEDDVTPCHGSVCRACKAKGVTDDSAPGVFVPAKPSEWLRKPTPIHHLTDASRTGTLSNQHIAEAVAWSVRNVARGGDVLRGVVLDWRATPEISRRMGPQGPYEGAQAEVHSGIGWAVWVAVRDAEAKVLASGPETGPEGRAKADAALLTANIATIDGGALVLPGAQS